MKLKHVFYFHALFAGFAGLGFLFAPAVMWTTFGTPSESPVMELAGRNNGVFLVLVALTAFFTARSENVPLKRNITLAYVIFSILTFVVYALPLLTGGPSFGSSWVISLVIALAYAYFYFVKPEA